MQNNSFKFLHLLLRDIIKT